MHPLVCRAQNPACAPLLDYARRNQWMALHALVQSTARVLLSAQVGDGALDEDWRVVRGFAELGMEERFKGAMWSSGGTAAEPDRAPWKKGYQLFLQAFKEPTAPADKKKLTKILRKPIKEEVAKEVFEYEAFLRGLGRMSLSKLTRASSRVYLLISSRRFGGARRAVHPALSPQPLLLAKRLCAAP